MKRFYQNFIVSCFFIAYLFLFLFFPSQLLSLSKRGLLLWANHVLPSLLPMMLLTGCMQHLQLTSYVAGILHPACKGIFHTSKNGSYCILVGFLCGFPMGAKVISDLLQENMLSKEEAKRLLPFSNHVGPVFFLSYVVPTLQLKHKWFYFCCFYAVPLIYGAILCGIKKQHAYSTKKEPAKEIPSIPKSLPDALEHSILGAVSGCLKLCGYILIFQIAMLPMLLFLRVDSMAMLVTSNLFEITNGLTLCRNIAPAISLGFLQVGGLSFLCQTIGFTSGTGLPIANYFFHKIIQGILTVIFVYVFSLLFSVLH